MAGDKAVNDWYNLYVLVVAVACDNVYGSVSDSCMSFVDVNGNGTFGSDGSGPLHGYTLLSVRPCHAFERNSCAPSRATVSLTTKRIGINFCISTGSDVRK
jgi:hypothetical protein